MDSDSGRYGLRRSTISSGPRQPGIFDRELRATVAVEQGDRVRAQFQLNVRHVQERGGLEAGDVNPDGRPFAYRINDPHPFILSTTFDLQPASL